MFEQVSNSLVIKLIFSIFLVCAVFERVSDTFYGRGKKQPTYKAFQRWLFYALLTIYLFVVVSGVIFFFFTPRINYLVSFSGLLIFIGGVFLRRAAIHSLGDCWSVFIEVKVRQRIVTSGIYRYLRHPYYFAVILELLGFSLLCNYMAGVLIAIVIQTPLLMYRSFWEEKILRIYRQRRKF